MTIVKPLNWTDAACVGGAHLVFLAGGISNCSNWQEEATKRMLGKFKNKHFVLANPRRDDFDVTDPSQTEKQIDWEHYWLESSNTIFFWFPKETLCPITLFELGSYLSDRSKNLVIGCDPEYKRRNDVIIQSNLKRPGQKVVTGFEEFLSEVDSYLEGLEDEKVQ